MGATAAARGITVAALSTPGGGTGVKGITTALGTAAARDEGALALAAALWPSSGTTEETKLKRRFVGRVQTSQPLL